MSLNVPSKNYAAAAKARREALRVLALAKVRSYGAAGVSSAEIRLDLFMWPTRAISHALRELSLAKLIVRGERYEHGYRWRAAEFVATAKAA